MANKRPQETAARPKDGLAPPGPEPRLSFNRTVVVRCRMHLEFRKFAPGTIDLRLGAVRRLAYEAADCGLLSPDLASGIRRVKGVKKLGVRRERYFKRYTTVVSVSAGSGVGSP
jgi:hypothetical protein